MRPTLWGAMLLAAACAARQNRETEADLSKYSPAAACETCHQKMFVQHRFSMHHQAYEDPLFLSQLYGQLAPSASGDPRLAREAQTCLSCHSPITWLQAGRVLVSRDEVRREFAGVTCDFCHTVSGFRGSAPGNANFIVQPGETKLGPRQQDTDWHHAYHSLQTSSDFCGLCHSGRNTLGVETIATFSEWKASGYAKRGVQCQDCHMNAKGYLVDGVGVFDSGEAADMEARPTKGPAKIFSHRFPGAHSASQLSGAMEVSVRDRHERLVPGQKLTLEVLVNNSRAGHKMPTGSAELRLLWLEVRVGRSDDSVVELLRAKPSDPARPLDVAGSSPSDAAILGADIPAGARLYRAVHVDQAGAQTQEAYLAAKTIFDSRLESGEIRTERFEYTVPADLRDGDDLHVEASLKYLTAPSAYYRRFGLPPRAPVVMAADTGRLGTPEDERELRP